MKMFFSDKYGRSIECEQFQIFINNKPRTALYLLDKKRNCLIVKEEIGQQLAREKKQEEEAQLWTASKC